MELAPLVAAMSRPAMIAVAIIALGLLYLGFKATKLAAKMFLLLIAVLILAGAGMYFLVGHAH